MPHSINLIRPYMWSSQAIQPFHPPLYCTRTSCSLQVNNCSHLKSPQRINDVKLDVFNQKIKKKLWRWMNFRCLVNTAQTCLGMKFTSLDGVQIEAIGCLTWAYMTWPIIRPINYSIRLWSWPLGSNPIK